MYKLFYILPPDQAHEATVYNPTDIPGYVYAIGSPVANKLNASTPSVILVKHVQGETYMIIRRTDWPNTHNATINLFETGSESGEGNENFPVDIGQGELNLGTPFGISASGGGLLVWFLVLILITEL